MVATPQKEQSLAVQNIPISQIKVGHRFRSTSKQKIEELKESIRDIGLLHPISVSKKGNSFLLLAGNHRVESFKSLNRTTIPAVIHECNELIEQLIQCEENLVSNSLTVLQVGDHIKLRERLLRQLGKLAKSGDNRFQRSGLTNEDLAKGMRMDKKSYQRRKQVSNIHPKAKEILNETEYSNNLMDMVSLSSQGEDIQLEVAKLLSTGKTKSYKRALTLARCKCLPFEWNEEQQRIKDLIGNPFSVMKFSGDSSPLSRLCKLVSNDPDLRDNKNDWGTNDFPLASQHPDQCAWFIQYYTKEGDVVSDPFVGRGSSALVASALGRKFVGHDLSIQNLEKIRSVATSHTPIKNEDLILNHSCGVELAEYEGQENIWDCVLSDPPFALGAEKYGQNPDPRDLCLIKDIDGYTEKMEQCLINLKRLIKPSNWETKEFHPIVMKVGSARRSKTVGLIDIATELEIIGRKIGLKLHDKSINVLDSMWGMFNASRCIDNKYTIKIHETCLVFVKY